MNTDLAEIASFLTETGNDYTPFSDITTPTRTTITRPTSKPFAPSRRVKDLTTNTTREKEPHDFRNESRFNLHTVSIEQDNFSSLIDTTTPSDASPEFSDIIEHEGGDYVDVLDEKDEWKPKLVFENKTETTTAPSSIMRIGPKKTDVELFNIEEAPFKEGKQKTPHELRIKTSMRLSFDIG